MQLLNRFKTKGQFKITTNNPFKNVRSIVDEEDQFLHGWENSTQLLQYRNIMTVD